MTKKMQRNTRPHTRNKFCEINHGYFQLGHQENLKTAVNQRDPHPNRLTRPQSQRQSDTGYSNNIKDRNIFWSQPTTATIYQPSQDNSNVHDHRRESTSPFEPLSCCFQINVVIKIIVRITITLDEKHKLLHRNFIYYRAVSYGKC